MRKFSLFLIALFWGFGSLLPAQTPAVHLVDRAQSSQSSYFGFGQSNPTPEESPAFGRWTSGASIQTEFENNPWWQVDLQTPTRLQTLHFEYPEQEYPAGSQQLYVFLSAYPMEDPDLHRQLSAPAVEHVYVSDLPPTGVDIPLGNRLARYIRVQLAGPGRLTCDNPRITGSAGPLEIPGNGMDDDKDGLTDCDDPDVRPVFRAVLGVAPSCPDCADGALYIRAGGRNLSISLDSGRTFRTVDGPDFQVPVAAGTYQLVLANADGCTAAYSRNPVVIKPGASEQFSCNNGNFQNGWTNWSGALGEHNQDGSITFNQIVIDPMGIRHALIPSNPFTADPTVGSNIPLVSPTGSATFARLGDLTTANNNAQRLAYCFTVDPTNAHFSFWYAAVLYFNRHPPSQSAFFTWTVKNAAGQVLGSHTLLPASAAEMHHYKYEIFFAPWNCASVDLTESIGQQVCVEFTTGGCAFAYHGGYAYIDGLCESPKAASIQVPDVVCFDPGKIDATASGGSDYFGYFWEVQRLDANGDPEPNTLATNQLQSGTPIAPFTDILGFWRSAFPGQKVRCGDRFRVTLNLNGRCPSNIVRTSGVFTVLCTPPPIDYCNLAICPGYTGVVQMQGTGNCPGCQFSWRPPDNMQDSHVAFPAFVNPNSAGGFYNVATTFPNGCRTQHSVEVWEIPALNGQFTTGTQCSDPCSVRLVATYLTNKQIDPNRMVVRAAEVGTNTSMPLAYNAVEYLPNNYIRYKFISQPVANAGSGPNGGNPVQYTITLSLIAPPGYCTLGSCEGSSIASNLSVSRGLFWGYPDVFLPNVFDLTASNPVNRVFNPFFSNGITAPGVYWMSIEIYDRWGGLVYQNEHSLNPDCNTGTGLAGTEPGFPWNGHWNNDWNSPPAEQGIYTYVIKFRNCQNTWQLSGDVALLW